MAGVTIRGVLFDYSGTLFRLDPGSEWVPDELDRAAVIAMMTSPTTPSEHLPAELADDWQRRDLDPDIHRGVYLAALRASHPGVPDALLEALYERTLHPDSWKPYPDALAALRRLRAAGIAVGVVSNIPWDIREVFARNGMGDLVDEFVLSYAEGVTKPDPKIFLAACERIGVAPEHTLMIGDSEHADGGAIAIGCRFAVVEALDVAQRPDALLSALAAHGAG